MTDVQSDSFSDNAAARGAGLPCRRPEIREFLVGDEAVLVRPKDDVAILEGAEPNRAVALNNSSRAIWELCDGNRSLDDIVGRLEARFQIEPKLLRRQIESTIARMAKLGFIDGVDKSAAVGTATTFVIGIEDKPYFWWQAAIFLESLRDKLPEGWRTLLVVCNDDNPVSHELGNIISTYQTDFAQGANYANSPRLDVGSGGGCYAALNRVEALSLAGEYVDDDDIICLLDSDTFFYRGINLDIMPTRCAAPKNWHIESEPFFSSGLKNQGCGVDLAKLLEAIGCDEAPRPGGVNVFVTGEVAKSRKFIADCFRFAQALFLLGRIAGATNTWMAEMPCFTLAMTANGIPWDLLEREEFFVSSCREPAIPSGSIYHYYCDPGDFGNAAFLNSKWHKQAYRHEDFLRSDFRQFIAEATTDHEKYFFELAQAARARLHV